MHRDGDNRKGKGRRRGPTGREETARPEEVGTGTRKAEAEERRRRTAAEKAEERRQE